VTEQGRGGTNAERQMNDRRDMSEKKKREAKEAKEAKDRAKNTEGADAQDASGESPPSTDARDVSKENSAAEDESARYMRLAADFQNYKKRTEKEKSDIYAYANEKFAADILDVMDNFERAIGQDAVPGAPDAGGGADANGPDSADEKFLEGMRLIMEQLVNVLERNDVTEIDAVGAEFDPNLHHAVQMEDSDEYGSGKVTKVIQKGYMIKDKVLRPAMVMVAK
jgi:molecular chaperone GrpE